MTPGSLNGSTQHSQAVPITWTLQDVFSTIPVIGSFDYDADTNVYSNVNIDYSDAAFASDVIAVLDDLSIDSAHVFGYSLGGWVAFELAATFPSRTKSVIAGGVHPYEEDVSPIKEFTPTGIVTAWDELGAPLSSASKDHLAKTNHQQLIDILEDRVDLSGRLMSLTMPFLAICGTEDWRFEEVRRFAREKDGCQLVALDGHDHLSAWLQTELVLPHVIDFLRQ